MAVVAEEQILQALIQQGLVTANQLAEVQTSKMPNQTWTSALVDAGLVTVQQIQNVSSTISSTPSGVGSVDLNQVRIETVAVSKIPQRIAEAYNIIPIRIRNDEIIVAMQDPNNLQAIDQVNQLSGLRVKPVQASPGQIQEAIKKQYIANATDVSYDGVGAVVAPVIDKIDGVASDAEAGPAVQALRHLISLGVRQQASDIHVEPREKGVFVRYRIDGLLRASGDPLPGDLGTRIIPAIKSMAEMDIAETRHPQDGRIRGTFAGKPIDIRVSLLPTYFGEKTVMRLLDKSSLVAGFDRLGFAPEVQERFENIISRPQGIVLVTGPTGSGKTTTLYAALLHVRQESLNIVTTEDPIEYQLDGISQSQANYDIDLTFASLMRSILRQDPDVILVGEIRDHDTAEMAFRASLTGHLVLSTLHTNDAISSITRLLDMNVEPFLVAASLTGILGQRLVRRICGNCRQAYQPGEDELFRIGLSAEEAARMRFFTGSGCNECANTGYSGRVGLYELLDLNRDVREAIGRGAPSGELRQLALGSGMRTMLQDGIAKISQGVTTPEEIGRVVFEIGE